MDNDRVRVTLWSESSAPSEQDLLFRLESEGFRPTLWSRIAGHMSYLHAHDFDKVVYVLRGRISYNLPESHRRVHLGVGDRVDLPAWVMHNVTVGPDGVDCIEGRRLEH